MSSRQGATVIAVAISLLTTAQIKGDALPTAVAHSEIRHRAREAGFFPVAPSEGLLLAANRARTESAPESLGRLVDGVAALAELYSVLWLPLDASKPPGAANDELRIRALAFSGSAPLVLAASGSVVAVCFS